MIHHMKENIVFADSKCFTILNKVMNKIIRMSRASDLSIEVLNYCDK